MKRVIFLFTLFTIMGSGLVKADEVKSGVFDDVKKLLEDRSQGNPYDRQRVASVDQTSDINSGGSGGSGGSGSGDGGSDSGSFDYSAGGSHDFSMDLGTHPITPQPGGGSGGGGTASGLDYLSLPTGVSSFFSLSTNPCGGQGAGPAQQNCAAACQQIQSTSCAPPKSWTPVNCGGSTNCQCDSSGRLSCQGGNFSCACQ